MELGIISAQIKRPNPQELFHAIKEYGFSLTQINLSSFGKPTMPEQADADLLASIISAASETGVRIAAMSGTFNMIHPDQRVREEGIRKMETVLQICNRLHCQLVTLCTGTRSLDMWTFHPENNTKEAWHDMTSVLEKLLALAEKYKVCLGIEPEITNVVSSAEKARQILDEMQSPWLKIVMDGANLFHEGEAHKLNANRIIRRAFDLLGADIGLAHGKDILEGDGIRFTSAGRGIVDFDLFIALLREYGYKGGIILHGIQDESELPYSVEFLTKKLKAFQ